MKRTIQVALGEDARRVGTLYFDASGSRQHSAFAYDESWLRAADRFALAPALPLVPGPQYPAKSRDGMVFHAVIAESGTAARTMAAYIDLNPVRAGMVDDPADYRWSSYGEAVCGREKDCRLTRFGEKGDGKKAREGLVRAYYCDQGVGFDAEKWQEVSRLYRRVMGLALGKKPGRVEIQRRSQTDATITKNTAELLESKDNENVLKGIV
jgi:hypothetical protein